MLFWAVRSDRKQAACLRNMVRYVGAFFALVVGDAMRVSATDVPTVTLGQDVDGKDVIMPLVGAGTWQYNDTVAYDSVCKAFDAGYIFVDTAWGYGNEKGVGQAIQDCWLGKGKAREDLFVMTKIPGGLDTEGVQQAHADNMEWLQLDYVDHLMTHFRTVIFFLFSAQSKPVICNSRFILSRKFTLNSC